MCGRAGHGHGIPHAGMVSTVSGRRLGDLAAIALTTHFVTVPLCALAAHGAAVFAVALWARLGFLVPSLLASVLLILATLLALYLIWHADRSGGSLGVPDWPELSAASCALFTTGYIMQTAAFIVLIPAALHAQLSVGLICLICVSTAFLAAATLYAGFHAIRAFHEDEGEDVIEFENTNIKSPHPLDKDENKYWSSENEEDEVEEENGKGLQY